MIIKLTHPDEDAPPIYVNILAITTFGAAEKKTAMPNAETFVWTKDSPDELQVKEQPAEVCQLIDERLLWFGSLFRI